MGSTAFNINEKIKLGHNFALDQNYQELNYNDFGSSFAFNNFNVDFNYIEKINILEIKNTLKQKLIKNNDKNLISFETKRNLITNSSNFTI